MDFTFKSPYLFESMQSWKPAMAAHGEDALKKVYRDPSWRDAVRQELAAARGRLVFNGEWDKLFVVETAKAENRALEGATLAELARKAGKDPLDCILDFALSENLDTDVRGPAPAQRREGGRQDPGRSQHPHLAVAMPAPISPSSATRASACT